MIKIKEIKLANTLAHLKTVDELMIEGLIVAEQEMYDESNNYLEYINDRFDKNFDYYFKIIWGLKED